MLSCKVVDSPNKTVYDAAFPILSLRDINYETALEED